MCTHRTVQCKFNLLDTSHLILDCDMAIRCLLTHLVGGVGDDHFEQSSEDGVDGLRCRTARAHAVLWSRSISFGKF